MRRTRHVRGAAHRHAHGAGRHDDVAAAARGVDVRRQLPAGIVRGGGVRRRHRRARAARAARDQTATSLELDPLPRLGAYRLRLRVWDTADRAGGGTGAPPYREVVLRAHAGRRRRRGRHVAGRCAGAAARRAHVGRRRRRRLRDPARRRVRGQRGRRRHDVPRLGRAPRRRGTPCSRSTPPATSGRSRPTRSRPTTCRSAYGCVYPADELAVQLLDTRRGDWQVGESGRDRRAARRRAAARDAEPARVRGQRSSGLIVPGAIERRAATDRASNSAPTCTRSNRRARSAPSCASPRRARTCRSCSARWRSPPHPTLHDVYARRARVRAGRRIPDDRGRRNVAARARGSRRVGARPHRTAERADVRAHAGQLARAGRARRGARSRGTAARRGDGRRARRRRHVRPDGRGDARGRGDDRARRAAAGYAGLDQLAYTLGVAGPVRARRARRVDRGARAAGSRCRCSPGRCGARKRRATRCSYRPSAKRRCYSRRISPSASAGDAHVLPRRARASPMRSTGCSPAAASTRTGSLPTLAKRLQRRDHGRARG